MNLTTFESWQDAKTRALVTGADSTVHMTCTECGGFGVILDEGVITGEEFEATCTECDGEGTVELEPNAINTPRIRSRLTRDMYLTECKRDLEDLAAYTGQQPINVLADHGFSCYCKLKSKVVIWMFNDKEFRLTSVPEVH